MPKPVRHDATRSRRVVRSALAATAGVAIVVAGGATARRVFVSEGNVKLDTDALPPELRRAPDDQRLARARVADPIQPVGWGVRTYTSIAGDTCLVLGRVSHGRLGFMDGARLEALPRDAPGVCIDPRRHIGVTIRNYGSAAVAGGRTVLYGFADRTIDRLTLNRLPARKTAVPIADDGTFILVIAGANKLRHAQLVAQGVHGRTVRGLAY